MSYYLGQKTDDVKPITRRTTWTRPMFNVLRRQGHLMTKGRCPINRPGYPTEGKPVAVERAFGLQLRRMPPPGQAFGWHKKLDLARMRAMSTPVLQAKMLNEHKRPTGMFGRLPAAILKARGTALGTVLPETDMSLEPGQLGGLTDFFKVPALTSAFSTTPTVAAPAPSSSSFWNPIASVVQLWNERPQVLKDIKIKIDPNKAMAAAQQVLKPGQVSSFVDKMGQYGVNLNYQGMPISGQTAGFGYRLAGFDWAGWMPWIIGGGAALVILPMVFRNR